MTKINVIPMDPSAEDLQHPDDGVLGKGASWTYDTFTTRLIMKGAIAIATAAAPANAAAPTDAAPSTSAASSDASVPAAADPAPAAPAAAPAPAAPAAKTK